MDTLSFIIGILLLAIFGVLGYYAFQESRKDLKHSHNIAVIGFPKSGKSTLITSIFSEIMFNNALYIDATVRGEETINKINEDIEKLKIGEKLDVTTDQDVYTYRFDYVKQTFFSKRNIKVQIGDYPGEDSEAFYQNFGPWLHKTPYFKWVMQADSYIFVIDLADVLNDTEGRYSAHMIKSIISAWQHIIEFHIDSNKKTETKNVSIVFTKSDLLLYEKEKIESQKLIYSLDMDVEPVRQVVEIKNSKALRKQDIENDFAELNNYFEKQNVKSRFIFASHYVYNAYEGAKLGMKEIIFDNLVDL